MEIFNALQGERARGLAGRMGLIQQSACVSLTSTGLLRVLIALLNLGQRGKNVKWLSSMTLWPGKFGPFIDMMILPNDSGWFRKASEEASLSGPDLANILVPV